MTLSDLHGTQPRPSHLPVPRYEDHPILRPRTIHDVRLLTARAAQLPGPYELDLAAYDFLAQAATDVEYLVRWVPRALGVLLQELAEYDLAVAVDDADGPSDAPPNRRECALIGATMVLTLLCRADSCDPRTAMGKLTPAERSLTCAAARLALTENDTAAARAWAICGQMVDSMGPSIT